MPVSRHGSRRFAGLPTHCSLTHRPLTKPMRSSIVIVLRWSRASQASGLASPGALNSRTSAPVPFSTSHALLPRQPPSQSTITLTATPERARSASASANVRPISSSSTMYISNRIARCAAPDRVQPRRVVLARVDQELDGVAADRVGAARSRVGALGEHRQVLRPVRRVGDGGMVVGWVHLAAGTRAHASGAATLSRRRSAHAAWPWASRGRSGPSRSRGAIAQRRWNGGRGEAPAFRRCASVRHAGRVRILGRPACRDHLAADREARRVPVVGRPRHAVVVQAVELDAAGRADAARRQLHLVARSSRTARRSCSGSGPRIRSRTACRSASSSARSRPGRTGTRRRGRRPTSRRRTYNPYATTRRRTRRRRDR